MTEKDHKPTLAPFEVQLQRIKEVTLFSGGHQEEADKQRDVRYAFLQEISNRLSAIKMEMDLDPQRKYLSLSQLDELERIINEKIAELQIKPEEITQSTEAQSSSVMKETVGTDQIGSTLRKITQTLSKLRTALK